MVQVPPASRIAVLPETVQTDGVMDAKLTGWPEEALAFRPTDPTASAVAGIEAKVRV